MSGQSLAVNTILSHYLCAQLFLFSFCKTKIDATVKDIFESCGTKGWCWCNIDGFLGTLKESNLAKWLNSILYCNAESSGHRSEHEQDNDFTDSTAMDSSLNCSRLSLRWNCWLLYNVVRLRKIIYIKSSAKSSKRSSRMSAALSTLTCAFLLFFFL